MEKILACLLASLILIQAWMVKKYTKTWLAPAPLYGGFWFFYTAVPLAAAPSAGINCLAVAYILLTCIVFSSSAFLFDWVRAIRKNQEYGSRFDFHSVVVKRLFFGLFITTVSATIVNWSLQGVALSDIVFNLVSTSGEYLSKRYSGELTGNAFAKIAVVFTYPTAILGGMLFGAKKEGERGLRYLLPSVASALLMMIVEANKGTFFLCLVLFWSGTLHARVDSGRLGNLLKAKVLLKLLAWAPAVLFVTAVSFLSRGLTPDVGYSELAERMRYYFVSYSSGHLYAFSDWFTSITYGGSKLAYNSIVDSNGFYTFMSVFKWLGTSKVEPPGYYDEYYYIDGVLQTNIYTQYRGLILDFGMLGSLVAMFASGLISHVMFYRLLVKKVPWISAAFYVNLLGAIYSSFMISIFVWNSIFASFVVIAAVLFLNRRVDGSAA